MNHLFKTMNPQFPLFSFYKQPVSNIIPAKSISIHQAYKGITGPYFEALTIQLRSVTDPAMNRRFKQTELPFVTFSGIFNNRSESGLITHSGLMVIDFDKLPDTNQLKNRLLCDPYFETQLLFTSPNGYGLKWVIEISEHLQDYKHSQIFESIRNYIKSTYQIEADPTGRDVARVCFLAHDPDCYIHPKYILT